MHNRYQPLSKAVFQDTLLQKKLDVDGYVVIPFLEVDTLEKVRTHYAQSGVSPNADFYSSSFETDEQKRNQVNKPLEQILDHVVSEKFRNYQSLGACFLTKKAQTLSHMPIHQDWTIVDESQYQSITIWIALQETNEQNGAIQVIPGSHRFSLALRSPTLPNAFGGLTEEMKKDLITLPMKAGEAFIFSHALLHASPPNSSSNDRVAATFGLVHQDASLCFYHGIENNQVEKYAVDADFFTHYNTQIGQAPSKGKLLETFELNQAQITPEEYHLSKNNFSLYKSSSMYKMIPIFKDEKHQAFFEKEGYLTIPLLDQNEVAELQAYYKTLPIKDANGFGFHVSMDNEDKNLCRKIREKIWGIALPKLEQHLKDFKPFVASYVIKDPNPIGVVPAHQDWSFVDKEEEGYCSLTSWIALVDTNIDNGGMGVIRGSHKFMNNKRPSPSPQTPVPLSNHMFSIFPYLHTLDVKAGEVLFFDNRTFHASPPNTTDEIRLAAGVGITQKDAQLVHYYMKPDDTFKTMLQYKVDEDFYLKYENATLSKMYDKKELIEGYGEPIEVPYSFTDYNADELIAIIKDAGNEYNVPMTEKLAQLFGYINEPVTQVVSETQEAPTPVVETPAAQDQPWVWVDDRSFLQKYTPLNILREIKKKVTG